MNVMEAPTTEAPTTEVSTKKRLINVFVIWIVISVVIFFLFSFAQWELNPKHWSATDRGFFAGLLVLALLVILKSEYE